MIFDRGYRVSGILSIRHAFPARDTLKITVSISTPDRSLSFVRHEQARTKNLACLYNALISQLSYRADPIYQFARKSIGACVVQAIMFSFHSLGINQSREHDQLSAKDLAPFPSPVSVGAGTVSSSRWHWKTVSTTDCSGAITSYLLTNQRWRTRLLQLWYLMVSNGSLSWE